MALDYEDLVPQVIPHSHFSLSSACASDRDIHPFANLANLATSLFIPTSTVSFLTFCVLGSW